ILVGWAALSGTACASRAQGPQPDRTNLAPARELGNHYVVLVDDSGDMKGPGHAIPRSLPDVLYDGIASSRGQSLPAFKPKRDRLTVLYFTPAPPCSGANRRVGSIAYKDLFEMQDIAPSQVADKTALSGSLDSWLGASCRFRGNASPIVTSQMLALPF